MNYIICFDTIIMV